MLSCSHAPATAATTSGDSRALISLPRVLEFGGSSTPGFAIGALIVGIAAFCAIAGRNSWRMTRSRRT